MASEYQDELAVLQLLHAALAEYGCPGSIVSDNGGQFKGAAYTGVLDGLNVDHPRIEKRKPWQNLIEAQFKIQLRLADAKFEQATTLEEIQARHAEFIHTFNTTAHWAHRQREDGLRTPEAVLGGVLGRSVELGDLEKRFRGLQFERTVNLHGCVSIQRFYVYAERGLARKRVRSGCTRVGCGWSTNKSSWHAMPITTIGAGERSSRSHIQRSIKRRSPHLRSNCSNLMKTNGTKSWSALNRSADRGWR